MLRKWMCLLWAVAVVTGVAAIGKGAEITGTVQIVPQCCGVPITEGWVSMRYAGTIAGDSIYLTDGLANWSAEAEELETGEWVQWILENSCEWELTRPVADGNGAVFTGVKKGIYLVCQMETDGRYQSFAPFFLKVPEGECWDVYRAPKMIRNGESPRTGDRPAPIIAAMGLGFSAAVLMVLVDERKK